MKLNEIHREYSNGEVTVIWRRGLCRHSGVCVQMLPKVYRPQESPWVRPEKAPTEQLVEQIKKCPSAALTYRFNTEQQHQ
jgi:uncharacterized Fe-S cluster protein YjdI